MNNMRFRLIVGVFLGCVFIVCPSFASAGLAVSVSGGDWGIGIIRAGGSDETSSTYWNITNDAATGAEDIYISVDDVAEPDVWTSGSTSGTNTYVLSLLGTLPGTIVPESNGLGLLLQANLYHSSIPFGLQFVAPGTGSTEGGVHTLTVTITADDLITCDDQCATPANEPAGDGCGPIDETQGGCPTCKYCDGTALTCQFVPSGSDNYDACSDTCTPNCDGAGACMSASDGTSCGSCYNCWGGVCKHCTWVYSTVAGTTARPSGSNTTCGQSLAQGYSNSRVDNTCVTVKDYRAFDAGYGACYKFNCVCQ